MVFVTEDYLDQMANDIFEQDQPKKKVRDLYDVGQYKQKEYIGDEDFNSAYITPQDITVTDLLPTDFERAIAEVKADRETIKSLRAQVEFQKREHIEMQKYTLELERQVAKLETELKESYKNSTIIREAMYEARDDVDAVRATIAKLTEERDNLQKCYDFLSRGFDDRVRVIKMQVQDKLDLQAQLTAAESRIAEYQSWAEAAKVAVEISTLDKCWKDHMVTGWARMYKASNLDALEAYRDGVIEECIDTVHRNGGDFYLGNALEGLKKGK